MLGFNDGVARVPPIGKRIGPKLGSLKNLNDSSIGKRELCANCQRGQASNRCAVAGQIGKARYRRRAADVVGFLFSLFIDHHHAGDGRLCHQHLIAFAVRLADLIQPLDD